MTKPHRRRTLRLAGVKRAIMLAIFSLLPFAAAQSALAETYTVLYTFTGTDGDGLAPSGDLIRDDAGNLYGSTIAGGTSTLGTIFKVDPSGTETVLYTFVGGTQGGNPNPGLIRDAAGSLYGTNQQDSGFISGTVFKVDATGKETILHTFGTGNDGQYPTSGLVRDADGNLYGTTAGGGTFGLGTVFKLDATNTETILYNFSGGTTGTYPETALIRDAVGNLYGATARGGDSICNCGIVFKLDPTGSETVLHKFTGADGFGPGLGLTRDAAGNLYGTTVYGGITSPLCKSGCGTVFKVNPTGLFTLLHSFTGKHDGRMPLTSLIRDAAGNLYGTTQLGGEFNLGTVFKIGPTGRDTVLHTFSGTDGSTPYGGLVEDAAGNLYGTAEHGGAFDWGVVFKLTP